MFGRAALVWIVLLVAAVANGGFREAAIVPALGAAAAHVISTLLLCAVIIALSWLTIGWIHPVSRAQAWTVGVMWVVFTVAFEFLAGHYLFGHPWNRLLADYNILRGRIWVLVVLATVVAPYVTASARGLLRSRH